MANTKFKLRIRQNKNIYGEWWTCYAPLAEGEFLQQTSSGETPDQAYINYFNPLSHDAGLINLSLALP
tara:strand:+ start:283 stop:486 length:204 start_codon:yes stop_codon:yes gene_type:complete